MQVIKTQDSKATDALRTGAQEKPAASVSRPQSSRQQKSGCKSGSKSGSRSAQARKRKRTPGLQEGDLSADACTLCLSAFGCRACRSFWGQDWNGALSRLEGVVAHHLID